MKSYHGTYARQTCRACKRDRGTVYIVYEGRHLCLQCAGCWTQLAKEAKDKRNDK
jgi:hypothetical protein